MTNLEFNESDLVELDPALLAKIAELVEGVEPLSDDELDALGVEIE